MIKKDKKIDQIFLRIMDQGIQPNRVVMLGNWTVKIWDAWASVSYRGQQICRYVSTNMRDMQEQALWNAIIDMKLLDQRNVGKLVYIWKDVMRKKS